MMTYLLQFLIERREIDPAKTFRTIRNSDENIITQVGFGELLNQELTDFEYDDQIFIDRFHSWSIFGLQWPTVSFNALIGRE